VKNNFFTTTLMQDFLLVKEKMVTGHLMYVPKKSLSRLYSLSISISFFADVHMLYAAILSISPYLANGSVLKCSRLRKHYSLFLGDVSVTNAPFFFFFFSFVC
jgi:hypothetical protein